jgi:hypothetical protein
VWWSLTWYNYGDRVVMTSVETATLDLARSTPDNNSPFAYNAMLFMPAKTVIRFLQCDYASVTLYLLLPHAPLSA